MPFPSIAEAARATAQPVLPALLVSPLREIEAKAQGAQVFCLDLLPEGCLTPLAARSIGSLLQQIRDAVDAAAETLRLKVKSLDGVTAVAGVVHATAGISEAALYRRLARRGFRAADIHPAVLALVEKGDLLRVPDPEQSAGKRGPKPHRLSWRRHAP